MKHLILISIVTLFYFKDVVKVVDDTSIYFNCKGEVESLTKDHEYYVTGLCGEFNITGNFRSEQLGLVRRRK